ASSGAPSAITTPPIVTSWPATAAPTCSESTRSFITPDGAITPQAIAKLPPSSAQRARATPSSVEAVVIPGGRARSSAQHLQRLRVDDVARPLLDEVDHVVDRGAEVLLVAVELDVADVRRAHCVLQPQQRVALQDRLALEHVD